MNSIIFNKTNTKFSYEDSIEICYEIIKKNYENFPIYMFFLNKRLMDDFATLYAFSRGIDYIGDELPPKKVIKGLEIWEKELDLAFNNKSTNPIFVALQKTIKKYNLSKLPFEKLIKANSMDQKKNNYESIEELFYYCDHSANPVGELVLSILGYKDKKLIELSNKICTGLQITNFIQDIQIDLDKNRIYIPNNLLKKHKVNLSKLKNENMLQENAFKKQFEELLTELIHINKNLYEDGQKLTSYLNKKHAVIIQIFISSGEKILNKIKKKKVKILSKKPKTNSFEKISIIFKSIFKTYI